MSLVKTVRKEENDLVSKFVKTLGSISNRSKVTKIFRQNEDVGSRPAGATSQDGESLSVVTMLFMPKINENSLI